MGSYGARLHAKTLASKTLHSDLTTDWSIDQFPVLEWFQKTSQMKDFKALSKLRPFQRNKT